MIPNVRSILRTERWNDWDRGGNVRGTYLAWSRSPVPGNRHVMSSIAIAAPLLRSSGDAPLEARTGELFRRLERCEEEEEAQDLAGLLVKAIGFTYFSYGAPL